MTISEPLEEAGFFWLPDNPERRVPGFLRVSQWGAPTLETISLSDTFVIDRSFGDPWIGGDPINFERIIGITKSGPVTLDDCKERSGEARLGRLSTSHLDASRLFVGVGYGRDSEIAFSELRFSIQGLDEWLGISGIEVVRHESTSGFVHFARPDPIKLRVSDEICLEFNFSGSFPWGFNVKEARISQKAHISLISSTEKPLDDFLSLAHKIRDFFSFVTTRTAFIDSLTGYSNEVMQKGRETSWRVPVGIHYRSSPTADVLPEHRPQDMLFAFSDVEEDIENVFTKWIENYDSHESVFKRYFLLDLDNTMDLERRFCLLSEGMAAIHKSLFAEKAHTKDGPVTKDRLREMMKPFERFFGTDEELDGFIGNVVEARNYFVHLHRRDGDFVPNTEELFEMNSKLEALYQLFLLRSLGIEEAHLDRIAKENRRLRGNLEYTAGSPYG